MTGGEVPNLITELPGPRSRERVDVLARHECPGITARRTRRAASLGAAHDDPIVWAEAVGANVRDVDGNVLVDLTSGFGVALVGHRHPEVVAAAQTQATQLVHAMGDAWPDATRIRLLEQLARTAPPGLEVAILGLSGSDAIDAAIKTAMLATGRRGVLAFSGGYHGLALGTVGLQAYNQGFTEPFRAITHPDVVHLPWGCEPERVAEAVRRREIGLVLVEPVLGRGGMRPAEPGWLLAVAAAARSCGALFAFDEIYTAFGRAGANFAGPDEGVEPDLVCVGKALGGGYPISACLGTRAAMDAWGASRGEAIHTQTFLGHPIGCAAALAVLEIVRRDDVPGRARALGAALVSELQGRGYSVRGRGLMLGIEIDGALGISRELLRRGFLVLPAGVRGEVLGLTPPVCISEPQIEAFLGALDHATGRK